MLTNHVSNHASSRRAPSSSRPPPSRICTHWYYENLFSLINSSLWKPIYHHSDSLFCPFLCFCAALIMQSPQDPPNKPQLFKNKEGVSLKFRIQPGFNSTLRSQLENAIEVRLHLQCSSFDNLASCVFARQSHGGTVLSKIPIHGLVLIDPKSRAGRELLLEWAWPERPYRFFVSYTYILACVDTGRLLPLKNSALKREAFAFGASKNMGRYVYDYSALR